MMVLEKLSRLFSLIETESFCFIVVNKVRYCSRDGSMSCRTHGWRSRQVREHLEELLQLLQVGVSACV